MSESARGILNLEREGRFRAHLLEALAALGYRVLPASSFEQALAIAGAQSIALVVADAELARLSWVDLVTKFRVASRDPGLGVLLCSDRELRSDEVALAMRAGLLGVLQRGAPIAESVYRVHAQLMGHLPARFQGAPRVEVRTPVRFSPLGIESTPLGAGVARNLSRTGMLFSTAAAAEVGARIQLSFQLPRAARPIECEGLVARVVAPGAGRGGRGLGVAFQSLRPADEHTLARFVVGRLALATAEARV